MQWNERALIEYEFNYGKGQRKAVARLGFPECDAAYSDEWVCSFQIEGLKDGKVSRARGADGLQALTIACMAIRAALDRLKMIKAQGAPYEVVFPRYLPFCLGVEFHRNLCQVVDARIALKKKQLAKRRSQQRLR